MADSSRSSPAHPEPVTDPTTVVGLIFRILNRPSRTLCLLAILALVVAGLGQLLHAPPIAGLPIGVWGMVISGGSLTTAGTGKLVRYLLTRKQDLGVDGQGDLGSLGGEDPGAALG